MKKYLIIVIIGLTLTSCNQNELLMSEKGVGDYIIGNKLNTEQATPKDIEIKTDPKGIITQIVISSEKYKTKDKLGVQSSVQEVQSVLGEVKPVEAKLSKGAITIGNVGQMYTYGTLSFNDMNSDDIVDFVLISK